MEKGDLVPCGAGCGKMTKYTPPYPPDECLCDECSNLIGEMIKKDEM